MRPIPALLAILLLGGCYTQYDLTGADWAKSGTMIQQTSLDEMDCVRGTREAGSTTNLQVGGMVDITRYEIEEAQRRDSFKACMTAKGYQPK